MTEEEWLAGRDCREMLAFIQQRTSHRKLRLYGCACTRQLWNVLKDERSRNAVVTSELFADGLVSEQDLATARRAAEAARDDAQSAANAAQRAWMAMWRTMLRKRDARSFVPTEKASIAEEASIASVEARAACQCAVKTADRHILEVVNLTPHLQASLLLEIFGNPFHSVAMDAKWLRWQDGTVAKLAQAVYNERRFSDLPILADALEDAGCTSQEILSHCRSPGLHVRGCWAVDLILSKDCPPAR
jgi:hypothetical protein